MQSLTALRTARGHPRIALAAGMAFDMQMGAALIANVAARRTQMLALRAQHPALTRSMRTHLR